MNYNENNKIFCGAYPQVYFPIFWKLQNDYFKNKAQWKHCNVA